MEHTSRGALQSAITRDWWFYEHDDGEISVSPDPIVGGMRFSDVIARSEHDAEIISTDTNTSENNPPPKSTLTFAETLGLDQVKNEFENFSKENSECGTKSFKGGSESSKETELGPGITIGTNGEPLNVPVKSKKLRRAKLTMSEHKNTNPSQPLSTESSWADLAGETPLSKKCVVCASPHTEISSVCFGCKKEAKVIRESLEKPFKTAVKGENKE